MPDYFYGAAIAAHTLDLPRHAPPYAVAMIGERVDIAAATVTRAKIRG